MFMFWNDRDMEEDKSSSNFLFAESSPKSVSLRGLFKLDDVDKINQIEPQVEKEEIDLSIFNWSGNGNDESDLTKKRINARMRSKKTRERKKSYFQELELKIKNLEIENAQLKNELEKFKNYNSKNIDLAENKLTNWIENFKSNIIKDFFNDQLAEPKSIDLNEFFQK